MMIQMGGGGGHRHVAVVGAVLLLAASSHDAARAEQLSRVVFSDDFAQNESAFCLDGTPAGYYVHENNASDGWVVYLQGGGLCVTPIDCAQRAKNGGKEGSSLNWSPTFSDTTNVLSDVPDNPFQNYSKVWVPYCSGDTWTGTTLKNIYLDGYHTTGHNNVKAVLDHLHQTTSFGRAKNLLLSGGSAGGIGVFHNADFVGGYIKQLGIIATYKATPQAGYFFPGGVFNYQMYAAGLRIPFDIFGADFVHFIELGYMNEKCVAALGDKKARCWDVNVVQKYLETPLFIAQNLMDSNQIHSELLCPGDACTTSAVLNTTAGRFMKDCANKTVISMQQFELAHVNHGVFAPACLHHTEDLCMTMGPKINNISYSQALGAWYFETGQYPTTLVDNCTTDELFCNPTCGGGGCGDA